MEAIKIETELNERRLLSREIDECIGARPHPVIRYGNSIFLLIIFLVLFVCSFIQSPEKIKANAQLLSKNPPKEIYAMTDGKLIELFIKDEEEVEQSQVLGLVGSTADFKQIDSLKRCMDLIAAKFNLKDDKTFEKMTCPDLKGLGELQNSYQEFCRHWSAYKQTIPGEYYSRKLAALGSDLTFLQNIKANTLQQKKLQEKEKEWQSLEYKAYESLAKDKVIAPLELNQYKSTLNNKEQSLSQINNQLTTTELNSLGKKKEILDLQQEIIDIRQQLQSSLNSICTEIMKWYEEHVLLAPLKGRVIFASTIHQNELLHVGQVLFFIEQPGTNYYAELIAGQQGFGKIKPGQKVLLNLESYPVTEYGQLEGFVETISRISANRDSFHIIVKLPAGIQTNRGHSIYFRNGLTANAEIITGNKKLLSKLLGELKTIFR